MMFNMNGNILMILGVFLQTVTECDAQSCSNVDLLGRTALGVRYDKPLQNGRYPEGTIASFSCQEGYSIIGITYGVCSHSEPGEWFFDPRIFPYFPWCQYATEVCPSLSLFDGKVSYSRQFPANQADRHGIVATFRCPSDRWVLVGSGSATCNSVGDWSYTGAAPACVAACNPVSPFFSTTTFDKSPIEGRYPVGTIATFSCQFGERLRELRYDATRATVCSAGNSFTNTPTGCEPVYCLSLSVPARTSVTYSRPQPFLNKYNVGTEASFTCDSGFQLFGSSQRTCQTTGEWDGEPTLCAGTCHPFYPTYDLTPYINWSFNNSQVNGRYPPFTAARLSCFGNTHKLVDGDSQRICIDGWSGTQPRCQRIICPVLTVDNGELSYTGYQSELDNDEGRVGYRYNVMAEVTCNSGYIRASGPLNRACRATGWTGDAQICGGGQLPGYFVAVGDSTHNDIDSSNRTPEECAAWCNETANCYGFAAVEERPEKNSCWLKHRLRYPPNAIIESILSYYRLPESQGIVPQHVGYHGFAGDSPFNDIENSLRTPQDCADRCDTNADCYGFALVQEGSNMNRCWLKRLLLYPPNSNTNVLIYYKVTA